MGWREECTNLLKVHIQKATEPKEIREIGQAMSRLQPYEYEEVMGQPTAGSAKKVKQKKWVLSKKGK